MIEALDPTALLHFIAFQYMHVLTGIWYSMEAI